MKTYRFEVIITEGNDEFWESFAGKPGINEVQQELEGVLFNSGFHADVSLKSFHMENDG